MSKFEFSHTAKAPFEKRYGSATMRYFFHIFDGPRVFPDELGKSLSTPEEAIQEAKFLAAELRKAGEFCRSNLVVVVDENGHRIFECQDS